MVLWHIPRHTRQSLLVGAVNLRAENMVPAIIYITIESMKTTSMETVSTGVLDKNKEHYLGVEIKPKKHMVYQDIYDISLAVRIEKGIITTPGSFQDYGLYIEVNLTFEFE